MKAMSIAWQQRLRELVTQRLCNACIAREIGGERHTVGDWRRRLSLPPSPEKRCPRCCPQRLAKQFATMGVRNPGEMRREGPAPARRGFRLARWTAVATEPDSRRLGALRPHDQKGDRRRHRLPLAWKPKEGFQQPRARR